MPDEDASTERKLQPNRKTRHDRAGPDRAGNEP